MKTNAKLDNKGFSLVELIIVIAIMAILVGVVGTQVIPYIEKSRQSKDLQIISGFNTNMTSASASCASTLTGAGPYIINIAVSGTTGTVTLDSSCSGMAGASDLLASFAEYAGGTVPASGNPTVPVTWESKAGKQITTIKCIYDLTTGIKVVPYAGTNISDKISAVSTK